MNICQALDRLIKSHDERHQEPDKVRLKAPSTIFTLEMNGKTLKKSYDLYLTIFDYLFQEIPDGGTLSLVAHGTTGTGHKTSNILLQATAAAPAPAEPAPNTPAGYSWLEAMRR